MEGADSMSGKWSEDGSDFDDEDGYVYESDESDDDGDYEMKTPARRADTYTVYAMDEIAARQQQVADELSDVLALSSAQCSTILRHYKWNPQAVKAAWFDGGESRIRARAGIREVTEEPMTPCDADPTIECAACMGDVLSSKSRALACGHTFCNECWAEHLLVSLESGLQCLFTRCMDECTEAVPDHWFAELLDEASAKKYQRFLLYSFVEHNQFARWCSKPGCDHAVEYPPGGMRDIECRCGHVFCFACGMEPHRPAVCELVRQWNDKNTAESENVTWIIANTKNCPSCRNPIEKNQGCNHMTCRKHAGGCGHEFCWLCLGPWQEHGSATGGYYKCNKYEMDKAAGRTNDEDSTRKKAKTTLDKYIHYFDRYINHDRARKIAIRSLPDIEMNMAKLQSACGYKLSDVTFIREAAEQVIKCRQVLKYTYVHGYYLTNTLERNLFEHLQEMLEKHTEHLHGLVETPLKIYTSSSKPPAVPFFDHRSNVTNFAGITKKFLEDMLVGVEGGLTEGGQGPMGV